MTNPSPAPTANRASFGTLADGRTVEVITLDNGRGTVARVLSFGATLQALFVPDRTGTSEDIVLGYDTIEGYRTSSSYFGASVGRYANRIAGGRFALDGEPFRLVTNNGPNALHGGVEGFDKKLWSVVEVAGAPEPRVVLSHVSPDGEEGYPGTLAVMASFTLAGDGALSIEYRATTDRATIVNVTGHAYFNLRGAGSGRDTLDHRLTIPADGYTPVDATLIPLGAIAPVEGTPFDFRRATAIGSRIDAGDAQLARGGGYDHNWVLARVPVESPRLAARVEDPMSGRVLEVWSDQPGIQFYSGNFLDGSIIGKRGQAYGRHAAFCLEPQLFPDTPNRPDFGSARLDPGSTYVNRIVYRFATTKGADD